ncbi:ATP/GTP-binding protein [Streptomyces sp. NPDC046942]|uniref:ATP/GTP-binding protein n=1 Tax=Streptomyces sp. NPDC046942 TaxID=3155137 RepID=UPI0033E10CAA
MAESTLRSRVAAGWARAEGTVSKVVLLAVFGLNLVAQFVKPLGDALQGNVYIGGALLSLVGFLLYSEVQRLNSAHETQRETTAELRDTIRVLSGQVALLGEAQRSAAGAPITQNQVLAEFHNALRDKERIEFRVMCFTGETVVTSLKESLQALPAHAGREVTVRFLVPDFLREMDLPGQVVDGQACDSPEFRARLDDQVRRYERDLKQAKVRMRDRGQGNLSVEFQVLHFTPGEKLYLIDDSFMAEGAYDKAVLWPDENGRQVLDLLGNEVMLTGWRWEDGQRARDTISRKREYFDTLWDQARALTAPASATPAPPPAPAAPVPAPQGGD